ncbi:MAG TPA: hypothetical protein VHA14_11855, partial [Bryobacteraceae bacterium]|nr:hypothetical protein [Bryobacteraceae bacterium]
MLDFILVRAIFVLVFGFAAAYFRPGSVQFWVAAFYGAAGAVLAIFLERRFARISLKRTIGITIGVVAGLFCSSLVSVVLSHIGGDNIGAIHFIQVIALLVLVYFGAVTGAAKGELLNLGAMSVFGNEADSQSLQ